MMTKRFLMIANCLKWALLPLTIPLGIVSYLSMQLQAGIQKGYELILWQVKKGDL